MVCTGLFIYIGSKCISELIEYLKMKITADCIEDDPGDFRDFLKYATVDVCLRFKEWLEQNSEMCSLDRRERSSITPALEPKEPGSCSSQAEQINLNMKEEGATASDPVDKQWFTEHIAKVKDELKQEIMQDVLDIVDEKFASHVCECRKTKKEVNVTVEEESKKDLGHCLKTKSQEDIADQGTNNKAKSVDKIMKMWMEDKDENDEKTPENPFDSSKKKLEFPSKDGGRQVHYGVFCDHCDSIISGIRYKCRDCVDFDLCETCESIPNLHDVRHVFLKIRHPLMPCFATKGRYVRKPVVKIESNNEVVYRPVESNHAPLVRIKAKGNWYGKMHAMFVRDETVPDGSAFLPGTKFVKRWRVRNLSAETWNSYTTVRMIYAHPSLKPLHTEVMAPHIGPQEEGVVSVYFTAPKAPGYYESHWEFHQYDIPFGDVLWCNIVVTTKVPPTANVEAPPAVSASPETSSNRVAMTKNLRYELPHLKFCKRRSKEEKRKRREHEKRKVKHIFDVLSLSSAESERVSFCRRYVNSYTATPNNTPFDLSPPKSPEPKELVETRKEATSSCTDNNVDTTPEQKNMPSIQIIESDDKSSIVSISSSESDSEFVVIPMPKCFNLAEPFMPTQSASALASESDSANVEIIKPETPPMNITENNSQTSKSVAENVSQETGVPEHMENLLYRHPERQINEQCYIVSNIIHVSESPSSSSVSVIDSESNSPVFDMATLSSSLPSSSAVETNQDDIQKPEIEGPTVEVLTDNNLSGTFPKFPVEGIDPDNVSPYTEPIPTQDGEHTIQVLPEGLVTGALLAAATVYNTARGFISHIQPGKNEQEGSCIEEHTSPVRKLTPEKLTSKDYRTLSVHEQLLDMGFCNVEKNLYLLRKYNGNVAKVVEALVNDSDEE